MFDFWKKNIWEYLFWVWLRLTMKELLLKVEMGIKDKQKSAGDDRFGDLICFDEWGVGTD
jgi:hypothetical protein